VGQTLAYFRRIDKLGPGDAVCTRRRCPTARLRPAHFARRGERDPGKAATSSAGDLRLLDHANLSFFAAPTMIVRLLQRSGRTPAPEDISYGGACMSDSLRAIDLLGAFYQLYGQGKPMHYGRPRSFTADFG